MIIKATKNLTFGDGSQSFTKGKEYEVISRAAEITEHTEVYDDQTQIHRLGMWHKHFKIVSR